MKSMYAKSMYAKGISEAIGGVTDADILCEVEDIMRNSIFHSTLDWVSQRQFSKAAKEAYGLLLLQKRGDSKSVLPGDAEIAKFLKCGVNEIPLLKAVGISAAGV